MSDLNVMVVAGRLTKDAVLKTFPQSGKKFLEFNVANNTGYGQYAKVQYFNCMLVGDQRADKLCLYLGKGQQVILEGKLESNNYTNKEGVLVKDWKFLVNELQLVGGTKQNKGGQVEFEIVDEDLDTKLKREAQERYMNAGGTF